MRHGARIEKLVQARRNVEPPRNTGLITRQRQRQRSYPFCNKVAGVRAMLPFDRQRFGPAWIMLERIEAMQDQRSAGPRSSVPFRNNYSS
jgi:hypothetical protein